MHDAGVVMRRGGGESPSYVEHSSRSASRASRLAQAAERAAQLAPHASSHAPHAPKPSAGWRAARAQGVRPHARRFAGRLGASHSTAAACLHHTRTRRAKPSFRPGLNKPGGIARSHARGAAADKAICVQDQGRGWGPHAPPTGEQPQLPRRSQATLQLEQAVLVHQPRPAGGTAHAAVKRAPCRRAGGGDRRPDCTDAHFHHARARGAPAHRARRDARGHGRRAGATKRHRVRAHAGRASRTGRLGRARRHVGRRHGGHRGRAGSRSGRLAVRLGRGV